LVAGDTPGICMSSPLLGFI